MTERQSFPLWRIMTGNALLLSALYLGLGLAAEAGRRLVGTDWISELAAALDALPGRALDLVGATRLLVAAYLEGDLTAFSLRLVFGATAVAIIFLMAVGVGLVMGLLRHMALRTRA